jgi:hypothetical protein
VENNFMSIKISCLDYSENQRVFHISDKPEHVHHSWKRLSDMIDEIDAIKFIDFMETKYVKGRTNGQLPSLDIVKLELELFYKLKNVRRKLV